MHVADPLVRSWKAALALGFERSAGRTVLARRAAEGPLVVQKALYPEGPEVCHVIVVHPPGGIAGGDELSLQVEARGHALLTTPGAAKWYRSAGPWAKQKLSFSVDGTFEWLPREAIVFDGARAELDCEVRLAAEARYIGWDIVCLGRTGSGERFARGRLCLETRIVREQKLIWVERGELDAGGRVQRSPVGLGGHSVFGTLVAAAPAFDAALVSECRRFAAVTVLPGLLLARYLGDSSEDAFERFKSLWSRVRPAVAGRLAVDPRIWRT